MSASFDSVVACAMFRTEAVEEDRRLRTCPQASRPRFPRGGISYLTWWSPSDIKQRVLEGRSGL